MKASVNLRFSPNQDLLHILNKLNIGYKFVDESDTHLVFTESEGLSLVHPTLGKLFLDFNSNPKYKKKITKGKSELLAKALGIQGKKEIKVLDGTCGLGEDSFFMMQLGAEVLSYERDPQIFLLLYDAYQRWIRNEPPFKWSLKFGSCQEISSEERKNIDVFYYDPMFPPKKKSALPRKEMQIFHQVVNVQSDEKALLEWGCAEFPRVVVKRPIHARPIEGPRPTHQFLGKAVRFDMYV